MSNPLDWYMDATSWIARRLGLIDSKNQQPGRWGEDAKGNRCYRYNRIGMFALGLLRSFGPLLILLAALFGAWVLGELIIPHWRIALPAIAAFWVASIGIGAAVSNNRGY